MEKDNCKKILQEARKRAGGFAYLISGITLMAEVSDMLVKVSQSLVQVQSELISYQGDDWLEHLQKMDAVNYLDEMVDFDPVSELEVRFFKMSGEQEALSEFLMQTLEKVEQAHSSLIDKLHEFNALLER